MEETTMQTMQKKSIQAVRVVVFLLFMCNLSMIAQESQNPGAQSNIGASNEINNITNQDIEMLRANLRATRAAITERSVPLTADEATKFWPIFDQYRKEAIKANDERWALIKEYAANNDTMTDAQAQDYIQKTTDADQQLLALRMKYVPVFEKVISPKKTALWYQVDRRIDLMINMQLSAKIPLSNVSQ
jgi:Spy/CpxP family protein refolding chaperone